MSKSMKLENVKLSFNPEDGAVRLSSSDPRLNKKAFSLQLSKGTQAYEVAAELLSSNGITVPYELALEKLSYPNERSTDPFNVLLGVAADGSRIAWRLDSVPPSLLVFGMTGQGVTHLLQNILEHTLRHPDIFNVFTWSRANELVGGRFLDITNLSSLKTCDKPVVILDDVASFHFDQPPFVELFKLAQEGKIRLIAGIHGTHAPSSSAFSSVYVGAFNLRARIEAKIDAFGPLRSGQAVLRSAHGKSLQSFNVFQH